MESANNILPEEMDITNVLETYKICVSKCKPNCIIEDCDNPYCLSNLYESIVSVEPELKLRQPNTFVGLNNLGKTCYINCLIQLWFHNINIKKAILNWDPVYDKDEHQNHSNFIKNMCDLMTEHDESQNHSYVVQDIDLCINELSVIQMIFALMEFGNQQTISPLVLIAYLNIDVNIEEDMEEFQNYLLTLIEDKLNSKSDEPIRKMIKDNFFCESKSITKCLNCNTESATASEFREICLNIKGHKNLTDSLKEYFQIEKMVENNKYFCTQCQSKQNADRQILLTSLPDLIHLKLIRYVYDSSLKKTTKLNTEIRCPYTIDMKNYFDLSIEPSKGKHVYNLYGVLIHKGQNTNVGHYITHIKDIKTGKWYEMDDAHVKMLNTTRTTYSNDGYAFKGLISNKSINILTNEYKTTDAYMLIYIKASTVMKLKTESTNYTLPTRLADFVNENNKMFEHKVRMEFEKYERELSLSNLIREIKSTKAVNDDGDAISLRWLISLTEAGPGEKVDEINNKSLVCSHKKLNPNVLHLTKYIGTKVADKLYSLYKGGPRLRLSSSLCDLCVINRYAVLCMSDLTNEHRLSMSEIPEFASTNSYSDDKNNVQAYWIGINSFESWQINYLKMFHNFLKFNDILPNAILPINHEELITSCISLIGVLDSTMVHEGLIKNDIEKDDDKIKLLESDDDISVDDSEVDMDSYMAILENQRTYSILNPYSEMVSIIDLDNIYIDDTEPYKPCTLNDEITCPHGNLCIAKEMMILIPEKIKKMLAVYFPKDKFFDKNTKPCILCETYYKNVYLHKSIHFMECNVQTKVLNTLNDNESRMDYTPIENRPYFCIPRSFLESWRRFVSCPRTIRNKPKLINKSLLCKDHNELLFEPTSNFFPTAECASVMITKNEWLSLIDYYEADCGIFVYFDENGIFQKSIPKVCQTCTLDEGIQCNKYFNAKVFIRVYDAEDQNSMYENCSKKLKIGTTVFMNSSSGSDLHPIASTSFKNNNNFATHDGAIRSKPRPMPKVKSVVISSHSTLLDLKTKIMEIFHIKPSNQHLKTSDGVELLNNEATMEELNILPDSVILARFDENIIIH